MNTNSPSRVLVTSIAALLAAASVPSLFADTVTVNNSETIASSVYEFSNEQGFHGWTYGYYNLTADGDATYQTTDFIPLPVSGAGYALGGNPPWTSIADGLSGHPNGSNNGAEHWAIRRYTVGTGENGTIDLNWFLRDPSVGDCCTGVGGSVYVNGVEVDTADILASDTIGAKRLVTLDLKVGDVIDLALKPNGNDFADTSHFGMSLTKNQIRTFQTTALLADSIADFSGIQGTNGWRYGYFNVTQSGRPDSPSDFIEFGQEYFNGSIWNWPAPADPPWTEITPNGGHPNGINNGDEHWATRRYVVQPGEAGNLLVEWNLSKTNPSGNGTGVHILLNGVEQDYRAVEGDDTVGVLRGVPLFGVKEGDVIDIALDPNGFQAYLGVPGGTDDGSDGSAFGAKIHTLAVPEPASGITFAAAGLALLARRRRRSS